MAQGERLTQAQIDAVAEALETSPSWRAAADHAGLNERTVHRYRERADQYANRNIRDETLPHLPNETDQDYPYWLVVQDWKAARSRLEMRLVQGVIDAGPKDWKAYQAMLKAGWPADWSDRVELTGAGGGPLQIEALKAEALTRAEEAISQIRAKREAAGEISGEEVDAGGE